MESIMESVKPIVESSAIGNKKIRQKVEKLVAVLTENQNKEFFICTHDTPDPDALASALAMSRVLEFLGIETQKIYYSGKISHPQNRAMSVSLNLPLKQWTPEVEKYVTANEDNCFFIFVDVCGPEQKNMSIPFRPQVVVDHHKAVPACKGVLFIHDEIGACATLMTDVMLNLPSIGDDDNKYFCFDHETDGMRELCTALAVAIKTDTLDFLTENSTDYDYKAYKILTRFMQNDKFFRIVNYELPPYMFEYEKTAWDNKKMDNPNFISGLGYLDDSRGDCIPYIADRMMRLQGVQTVVIYAIVGDKVRASVRNVSAAHDSEQLVADIFGAGTGGSKPGGIGGAVVPLGLFESIANGDSEDERSKLWENVRSIVETKFQKTTKK